MRREARLQQHELAIARHQEIDHLAVAVAGRDPLAHQEPQVARQRRIGIVDRLVLAHHAAQFARQVARAGFLRGIRHDLVGLHGAGRPGIRAIMATTNTLARSFLNGSLRRLQRAGALAGFGAPTRRRRSESDSRPPNAIRTGPHQINSTSGL